MATDYNLFKVAIATFYAYNSTWRLRTHFLIGKQIKIYN